MPRRSRCRAVQESKHSGLASGKPSQALYGQGHKNREVDALFEDSVRPVPQKDVDYRALPIAPTPEEYFLLSRIDGNVTVGALCTISGLSREATLKALDRLRQAGLIRVPGAFGEVPAHASATQPPSQQAESSAPTAQQEHASAPSSTYEGWPASFEDYEYDPEVLHESGVELGEEERKDLLFRHAFHKEVDYYTYLGVAPTADRKEVRDVYFKLSKKYHPDLYYNKGMGSYQKRVEDIFQTLNKANQILSHKKKRQDYDQELASRRPEMEQPSSSAMVGEQMSQPNASTHHAASVVAPEMDERKREVALAALLKRAEKYEAITQYVEAAAEYKKAFELKPDAAVALRGANLLMRSGEEHLDGAIELATLAAQHEPDNAKPFLLLGDAHEERGDYARARQCYERARQIEPSNRIIERRLKYLEVASK